jgi:hypothetical protein
MALTVTYLMVVSVLTQTGDIVIERVEYPSLEVCQAYAHARVVEYHEQKLQRSVSCRKVVK